MHFCVYSGPGVGPFSLRQSVARIRERKDTYELLSPEKLMEGSWVDRADVFIMPGGRDVPYDRTLSGKGTDILASFVKEGGHYIGICAGAYFACSKIEFNKGTELEITETRDLKFFQGDAHGPAFGVGEYAYESEVGARAAAIDFHNDDTLYAYFNGGCYFNTPLDHPDTEILANYKDLPGQPAAVIRCRVGKGVATLMGVHLEYSSTALSAKDPYLQKIIPSLNKHKTQAIEAFHVLVDLKGLVSTGA